MGSKEDDEWEMTRVCTGRMTRRIFVIQAGEQGAARQCSPWVDNFLIQCYFLKVLIEIVKGSTGSDRSTHLPMTCERLSFESVIDLTKVHVIRCP
jgi:hypothetical protein